jgi:type I restriction enzyme M protein
MTEEISQARAASPAPTLVHAGIPAAAKPARKPRAVAEPVSIEDKLWAAADELRGKIPPARYQDVVLGLVFLKYVSDAFAEKRSTIELGLGDPANEDYTTDPVMRESILEDRDEYTAANVYWVPAEARWDHLKKNAKQANIGELVDAAMDAIERENPSLRGVLPKIYGAAGIPQRSLAGLIDTFSSIEFDAEARAHDVLGRVYEYFLNRFGTNYGGEHYTPRCVVRLLVSMIEPFRGRVYDPCCGSGGMFVQSRRFVEEHGGRSADLSIYGQEAVLDTWRLAKMNLAIRGMVDANLGDRNGDTFHEDLHPDLRADFILANPPFNDSLWHGELLKEDPRWAYGQPPTGNANFAWVEHFIHHLAPDGVAGFVLANISTSTNQSGEGEIRGRIIEAGLVDCIVSLPERLFFGTGIPVSLWFISRNRSGGRGLRDRHSEVLLIDARRLGRMITRTVRTLDDGDIDGIVDTYHRWRRDDAPDTYVDTAGFSRSVTIDEIANCGYVLAPGQYVGAEDDGRDGVYLDAAVTSLLDNLEKALDESEALAGRVRIAIKDLRDAR